MERAKSYYWLLVSTFAFLLILVTFSTAAIHVLVILTAKSPLGYKELALLYTKGMTIQLRVDSTLITASLQQYVSMSQFSTPP